MILFDDVCRDLLRRVTSEQKEPSLENTTFFAITLAGNSFFQQEKWQDLTPGNLSKSHNNVQE